MHEAGAMRRSEGLQHRIDHGEGLSGTEHAPLVQHVAQGPAGDAFHDDEDRARPLVLALVVYRHNMWMGECGRRSALADEPRDEVGIGSQIGVHHLDRDNALEPKVGGEEYGSQSTASDHPLNPVAALESPPNQRFSGLRHAASLRIRCGRSRDIAVESVEHNYAVRRLEADRPNPGFLGFHEVDFEFFEWVDFWISEVAADRIAVAGAHALLGADNIGAAAMAGPPTRRRALRPP